MPRRIMEGVVVSTSANKTAVVKVERTFLHPVMRKAVRRSQKYHAHDELNKVEVGQTVSIRECPPKSKLKRWEVLGENGEGQPEADSDSAQRQRVLNRTAKSSTLKAGRATRAAKDLEAKQKAKAEEKAAKEAEAAKAKEEKAKAKEAEAKAKKAEEADAKQEKPAPKKKAAAKKPAAKKTAAKKTTAKKAPAKKAAPKKKADKADKGDAS